MWLVWKKVGLFSHYLTKTGVFQPGMERAWQIKSSEMAEIMANKYGGTVQMLSDGYEAA